MSRLSALLPLVLLASCALPRTIADLEDHSPAAELGRPAHVRGFAQAGAWFGGLLGGVFAIGLLPISYPLRLLAGNDMSPNAADEFLFWPATGGAALGHALFAVPIESVDFLLRRAWVEPTPMPTSALGDHE